MASTEVCEIRLVMATALTRRVPTVKPFPVQQPDANPCAGQPLPGRRGRIPVAGGHQAAGRSGRIEPGAAVGFWTSGLSMPRLARILCRRARESLRWLATDALRVPGQGS